MMQDRKVKNWIVQYLGLNSISNGFRVVGFNDSEIDASELRGASRLVQVYTKSGQFPHTGSTTGPVTHDVSIAVELLVASSSSVDLSVLNDPAATPADTAAALAASQKAASAADEEWDDLKERIFALLMDNDQQDLGYPGEVGNRWTTGWTKGAPLTRAANVIISGTIDFGFRVAEEIAGIFPVTPTVNQAVEVAINASADEAGTPQEGSAVLAGG